jgi:putative spermidine/putrescine transport system substrate-binding protein
VVAADTPEPLTAVLRDFARQSPQLVRQVSAQGTQAGWVAGAFAREHMAGRAITDVVLTDNVGLVLGAARQLWQNLPAELRGVGGAEVARRNGLMFPLSGEIATVVSAAPGGPLLLHTLSDPTAVPRTAAALLDFARDRPRRFLYARPGESQLGLQFISALPHLLGESDPANPRDGWALSWAYLEELGEYVSFYAGSSSAAVEELARGGCDLLPALLTTYLRERANGGLPEQVRFALFDNGPLIPLGLFLAVPQLVSTTLLPAISGLAGYLLRPEIQSQGFGRGLLPGAAAELSVAADGMLSPFERAAWDTLLPPLTAESIAGTPLVPPLSPDRLAYMMLRWDQQIGARFRRPR